MKVMILLGCPELSNEYEKYFGLGSGIFIYDIELYMSCVSFIRTSYSL